MLKPLQNFNKFNYEKNFILFDCTVHVMVSSCDSLQTEESFQDETALKSAGMKMNFRAHLSGDQEVPAVETNATGQAIFQLSKDGMTLSYKLIVAKIEDVKAAHIHGAPAGSNGGVIVALYSGGLIPGTTNGILAEGEIAASESLIEAMKAGDTYVNVHTTAFGGGEIRGQIRGN
jgi:hypothetical protein